MPHIHKYNQQKKHKEMYAHAFYICYKLKFLAIYIIKNSSREVGEAGEGGGEYFFVTAAPSPSPCSTHKL